MAETQDRQLKYHFEWLLAGWAMVGVIVYFSLTPAPPLPTFDFADKLFHVAAYAGLMFWFCQLYSQARTRNLYALGFAALGTVLEVLQQMGGVRVLDPADMLANITGIGATWLLWRYRPIYLLAWFEGVLHGKA